jgi:hypothetical protein
MTRTSRRVTTDSVGNGARASMPLSTSRHSRHAVPTAFPGSGWLATVTSRPPGEGAEVREALEQALRITDVITGDQHGLSAMLMGCDELAAVRALQRVPVQPARLRLATTAEILCVTGEDAPGDH